MSYTVHHRDPVQLGITSTVFSPEESDFSNRHTTLDGLAAYHRYVEAALHLSSCLISMLIGYRGKVWLLYREGEHRENKIRSEV